MNDTIHLDIICAGFGGQGIMVLGKVLAEAGMLDGKHVTWMPSYGAEVRGGTAHASVKISEEPIASPFVSSANIAIIMNGPSLDKFEKKISVGGLLILNTSMAEREPQRKDIDIIKSPLTDEAIKLGNIRVANVIAAGIFIAKKQVFSKDTMIKVIKKMAEGREKIIPVNIKALERGMEIGSEIASPLRGSQ
ncbi:MAG: 2-oxoacid:acceptor oxidoreductase family protein [Candidatus Omnitrophota bacterium]